MNLKWIGAVLIIVSCGSMGMSLAARHKNAEKALKNMIAAISCMESELQYRLTPLPQLCRNAAAACTGSVQAVFFRLAIELEEQISPEVRCCMDAALSQVGGMPKAVGKAMTDLGRYLGRFDLDGQLRDLAAVKADCVRELDALLLNRDSRLRSYQTLGLCAGAALAILLI